MPEPQISKIACAVIGGDAFAECAGLASITIGTGVTNIQEISTAKWVGVQKHTRFPVATKGYIRTSPTLQLLGCTWQDEHDTQPDQEIWGTSHQLSFDFSG